MRMKRTVSFLLMLVMLFGLFAGCGQQGGETKPGTEPQAGQKATQTTELNDLAPPRIAEELVPRLNAELKARDIPLEFVYQGEYSTQFQNEAGEWKPSYFCLYQAAFTDSDAPVTTERFDLSVDYWSEPTEPMLKLQIWVADDATEREREMHKTVCAIAAQLCDEQITEKTARELLAAEPSDTQYVTYNGEIGSFTKSEVNYVLVSDDPNEINRYADTSMYTAVFWQSAELTHTVYGSLSSDEEWYEIYFDQTPETLFGERIFSAPSVEELEQRINDAFVTKGVPITCTLAPYQDYGQWRGVFRWTTLEDPDYAYPEFPLEDFLESGWAEEEITEEVVTQHYHDSLLRMYFFVNAGDPVRKDAPVGYIDMQFWGEASIPELVEVICIACDPENGAADMSNLLDLEFVESDWEGYQERTLQKDDYSIEQTVNQEEGSNRYFIRYQDSVTVAIERYPTGEALLDPALLGYEFRLREPIVADGLFNYYGDGQGYETYFHGSEDYFYLTNLLNDFLDYTRSYFSIETYWDYNGEHNNISLLGAGGVLDPSVYRIVNYDVEIEVYYNENIQDYLPEDYWLDTMGSEYILRIPIGISLLMDESMTLEEAIALHTHAIEYDFIATAKDQKDGIAKEGFQVTVYGTGDVVHLLAENPETGENSYSVILREYVEYDPNYSRLIQHLDD